MASSAASGFEWPNPAILRSGCVAQLGERLRGMGATRVLLSSDAGLLAAGIVGRASGILRATDSFIGVVLPHVSRFNMPVGCLRYAAIARMIGVATAINPEGAATKGNFRPIGTADAVALYEEML